MAGHSHSANIAVRKGAQDKARGKLFTKLAKEIMVASKLGGPDLESNSRLRLAVARARGQSMPKDNIQRAIDKGAGVADSSSWEEISLEGYGPGGTAILARCLTDNRNRTAAEVRHAFSKGNGNLGTSGCVSYLFQRKGVLLVQGSDEETVMMVALDAGAEDLSEVEEGIEVLTGPDEFEACQKGLVEAGLEVSRADVMMIPDTRVQVGGADAAVLVRLLQLLDDCDDVQQVDHNADIAQEDLDQILGS